MIRRSIAVLMLVVPLAAGCSSKEEPAPETKTAYAGPTVTLAFNVTGMTCENCVATVTHTIESLDGVKSCEVSLDEERAVVEARDQDEAAVIVAAITGIGFGATSATSAD